MNQRKQLSLKWGYLYFCVVCSLFIFFQRTGKTLAEQGNIIWDIQYTITTLVMSVLVGSILGSVIAFIIYKFSKRQIPNIENKRNITGGKIFGVSVIIILLSWLPAYLAFYPGICTYDTTSHIHQIVNNMYTEHHPILYTLLIKGLMNLGSAILGSNNSGIAMYIALQMMLLALAFAYGIQTMHRYGVKFRWQVLTLILCMFYPFTWYMSVSLTKDSFFTAFVVLFLVAFCDALLEHRDSYRMGWRDGLVIVGAMGIVLFRNNGKYALLPMVIVLLVCCMKKTKLWKRLTICCLVAFFIGMILLSAASRITGAESGNRREMLSIPIQQFARCMIYHGGVDVLQEDDNTMDEQDKQFVNEFLVEQGYRYYNPSISDPVKDYAYTHALSSMAGELARTYLHLLSEYPGDFINAFLANNAGFLYVNDTSHANVYEYKGKDNLGYVQTHWEEEFLNASGIYKDSKWEWLGERMEEWARENKYLEIPFLKYLFVPGTFLWLYLIFLGKLLIDKNFKMCVPLFFVAGYYVTLLLGPTVQLRYIYPLMVVLPFLVLLGSVRLDNKGE